MKAVYITEFGGNENLEIRDVPSPASPTGSELLVRVRAAGLNRADLLQVRGKYPPPTGYSPNIPGLEFAGEVVEAGIDASNWKPGDRVFGITAGEAQSEYLLSDESLLAAIPENLEFAEAAAVPEAFLTAYDAVFSQCGLVAGETLLIHAVASGVGLAALQLGKAAGATVIGTSRTADKLERCRELGLNYAIQTGNGENFAEQVDTLTDGGGADVILDLVGGGYFEQNLASLGLKGRLILVGTISGSTAEMDLGVVMRKRATVIGTVLRSRPLTEKAAATRAFRENVIPLLSNGKIKSNVDRVFEVKDVVAAYDYLASNESFGKVVLKSSWRRGWRTPG